MAKGGTGLAVEMWLPQGGGTGVKSLPLEVTGAGSDWIRLSFTPIHPSPHHIRIRLTEDHLRGQRLHLVTHSSRLDRSDPFSDSESEDQPKVERVSISNAFGKTTEKAAPEEVEGQKENWQRQEKKTAKETIGLSDAEDVMDEKDKEEQESLANGVLQYMPIAIRPPKEEKEKEKEEVREMGFGRGRTPTGTNRSSAMPGGCGDKAGGGFSLARAEATEEDWDAEIRSAESPRSSNLRAGLLNLSPPKDSSKSKPKTFSSLSSSSTPLPASNGPSESGSNPPPPTKMASQVASNPPSQERKSMADLIATFSSGSLKDQPVEKSGGNVGKAGPSVVSSPPPATLEPVKPFGAFAASAATGSGQATRSERDEKRPKWILPKKLVLTEMLKKEDSVLVGEVKLQLGTVGVSEDRENHFHQPTAVAINERNGDIIVADSQNRLVKIFKCAGYLRALIGNEDPRAKAPFHDPSAIVVVNAEDAKDDIIAVKCDNGIHIISYDTNPNGNPPKEPQIIRTIKANGAVDWLQHPMGLALTPQGHLLTICNARNADHRTEVVIMEPVSGSLVRRFPFRPSAETKGSQPRFLDVWRDRVIVSDLGKNFVYVLSLEDGAELFRIGGPGRQLGKFTFVSGVAVDGAGNMIIGDAKGNRIQFFSENGTFLHKINFDKATEASAKQHPCPFPAGLTLTAHGHLAFTSRGHNGQIVVIAQLVARSLR